MLANFHTLVLLTSQHQSHQGMNVALDRASIGAYDLVGSHYPNIWGHLIWNGDGGESCLLKLQKNHPDIKPNYDQRSSRD